MTLSELIETLMMVEESQGDKEVTSILIFKDKVDILFHEEGGRLC